MPQTVKTVAAPNGKASECLSSRAPTNAPAHIRRMEIARLCHRGLLPPAKEESAASPVIVSVKTVVVKSGRAIFRTVAFLRPIAKAVSTMTAYKRVESKGTETIDALVLIRAGIRPRTQMQSSSTDCLRAAPMSSQDGPRSPHQLRMQRELSESATRTTLVHLQKQSQEARYCQS